VRRPAVVVGVIAKPHGVRGEVVVLNRSDNPDRWVPGATVYLADRALKVEGVRSVGRERLLVSFEGVADRTAADELRGELTVPAAWLPPLDDDGWWAPQLQGCEVVTDRGRTLGRIVDVVPNPANDIWVTRDEQGNETLLPAVADVVLEVDVEAKRIVVHEIPGLTGPDTSEA
jgi:16S rRNA processing protein RimM